MGTPYKTRYRPRALIACASAPVPGDPACCRRAVFKTNQIAYGIGSRLPTQGRVSLDLALYMVTFLQFHFLNYRPIFVYLARGIETNHIAKVDDNFQQYKY
jgi:hypothetical protein